jgi:hypothetical protein
MRPPTVRVTAASFSSPHAMRPPTRRYAPTACSSAQHHSGSEPNTVLTCRGGGVPVEARETPAWDEKRERRDISRGAAALRQKRQCCSRAKAAAHRSENRPLRSERRALCGTLRPGWRVLAASDHEAHAVTLVLEHPEAPPAFLLALPLRGGEWRSVHHDVVAANQSDVEVEGLRLRTARSEVGSTTSSTPGPLSVMRSDPKDPVSSRRMVINATFPCTFRHVTSDPGGPGSGVQRLSPVRFSPLGPLRASTWSWHGPCASPMERNPLPVTESWIGICAPAAAGIARAAPTVNATASHPTPLMPTPSG